MGILGLNCKIGQHLRIARKNQQKPTEICQMSCKNQSHINAYKRWHKQSSACKRWHKQFSTCKWWHRRTNQAVTYLSYTLTLSSNLQREREREFSYTLRMAHNNILVILILLSIFIFMFTYSQAQKAPAMFIFGDSLVDVGNNNHLKFSMNEADFSHYVIDFPNKVFTGRFSNGKNAADFLGNSIKIQK